ncbi:uncharacterized protein L969DRAFT_99549 [Mixia osmundae IAM 14324]|uniref:MAGE domain-containing protein n=1 Tax=Mixia osmundae (strain CBS 9802 / IAM 14324 / JCM 22182 / KY 12970) TaxID=764103 RepID=G7EAB3_MIXOS|nr:uncharacterized protein L969DRAFT_99549 [Mixia osmundae IAM 14324]KEI37832.1 hypothetical protein L969DRAFT_99549 [Mixia osmundae IAM 14324]GAA99773.1 hypothetical protein E5Q_06476 [Mixia osmundae IAM 14324]
MAKRKPPADPSPSTPRNDKRAATVDQLSSSDDEAAPSTQQIKRKTRSNLSAAELRGYAIALARYVIFAEQSRKGIRRDEIVKKIMPESSRNFRFVLEAAQEYLKKTFAMELVELRQRGRGAAILEEEAAMEAAPTRKAVASSQAKGKYKAVTTSKSYVLRDLLPADILRESAAPADEPLAERVATSTLTGWFNDDGALVQWKRSDQRALVGLLHVILSLILVNGRVLASGRLFGYLARMGLAASTALPLTPALTGDTTERAPLTLTQYIAQLSEEGYLEETLKTNVSAPAPTRGRKTKQTDNDQQYDYRWGPRADAEIGEPAIARFVADVYKPARPPHPEGSRKDVSDSLVGNERTLADVAKAAGGMSGKLHEVTRAAPML